jgi:hypothetical protein
MMLQKGSRLSGTPIHIKVGIAMIADVNPTIFVPNLSHRFPLVIHEIVQGSMYEIIVSRWCIGSVISHSYVNLLDNIDYIYTIINIKYPKRFP